MPQTLELQTRSLPAAAAQIEVRADGDRKTLVGYAAKYGKKSFDLGGFHETIAPGAFSVSLASKPDVSARVQHAGGLATIGRTANGTLRLSSDSVGLRYECDVPDTQAGRDILTLVRGGYVDKSSFAFSVRAGGEKWDWSQNPPIRTLTSVDIHDVSPVDGPAYEDTSVALRSLQAAQQRGGSKSMNDLRNAEGMPPAKQQGGPASVRTKQLGLPRSGFEVRAAGSGVAELRIYDIIGWPFIEAEDVARALENVTGDLCVRINSPGGSVFDGLAIYNLLRTRNGRTDVVIDGLAASAASFIAMAGQSITMNNGSFMMIHNSMTFAFGNKDELRKDAELLELIDGTIAQIYTGRGATGDIRAAMDAETWYTAEEAVAAGLADKADTVVAEELRCDPAWFRNTPPAVEKRAAKPAALIRICSDTEAHLRVDEAMRSLCSARRQ